jgi:peptidoglycan-associated lipoprotein
MMRRIAGFKFAALACCVLALAACTKKTTLDEGGGGGGPGVGDNAGPGTVREFQTEVGDTVYYLVDQSTLTPEGQETLRRQATWLQQYSGVTIQVEGHADERGTREYNIALSAKRATTTRNFLISQGLPGNRISSIAFGKEKPAALCDAESCWSQNRRTVTVITGGAN